MSLYVSRDKAGAHPTTVDFWEGKPIRDERENHDVAFIAGDGCIMVLGLTHYQVVALLGEIYVNPGDCFEVDGHASLKIVREKT